jgi:crotonobetainyl-CoA:carnitine CoA-transferase CaiB-like acyl-CoA transferase
MKEVRESAAKPSESQTWGGILALLDERVRRIAEEVVRQLAVSSDVGCVKVTTAMELLDMSEYRVRQLIREGKLKVVHPTPHTIRIPLSEIRRYTEGGS